MDDHQNLDPGVSTARKELRATLDPEPPGLEALESRSTTRRRRLAGIAVVVVLFAATLVWSALGEDDQTQIVAGPEQSETQPEMSEPQVSIGDTTVPNESNSDLLAPGESRPLADAPLSGRSTMAAAWTGEQFFVWGGGSEAGEFDDGATYDPRTDTWELLPDSPLSERSGPVAVWTGEEVLVWGGSTSKDESPDDLLELEDGAPRTPEEAERLADSSIDHRDGAAYNPSTRSWRRIAPGPHESAGGPIGLWNGSEMIVLAGVNDRGVSAYDPLTDNWRALPDLPGQLQAPNPVAVWAGSEVAAVVKRSGTVGFPPTELVTLRPGDDAWRTLDELISSEQANPWVDNPTLTSEPGSISWSSELGAGEMALAWTGEALVVASDTEAVEYRDRQPRPIAQAPAGWQPFDTPSVWTGDRLILWTGETASAVDPTASTWQLIPSGETGLRIQPAIVWADGVILTWGGFSSLDSGVMVRPPE